MKFNYKLIFKTYLESKSFLNLNIEYISLVIYNENIWVVNINECPIFRNVSFELINTLKINVFFKLKVKGV